MCFCTQVVLICLKRTHHQPYGWSPALEKGGLQESQPYDKQVLTFDLLFCHLSSDIFSRLEATDV